MLHGCTEEYVNSWALHKKIKYTLIIQLLQELSDQGTLSLPRKYQTFTENECFNYDLCCRYKEREKYDMEEDRISLYTDFPDIAYNVFFKRRMVLGFDEDGLPIISSVPVPNGVISHGDEDKLSLSDEFPGGIPKPRKGHEPFAYPTDYDEPPFDYDPYRMWPEGSVPPPVIPDPEFDFPEISLALRYRMPGRSHLQQVYPLQMFGHGEDPWQDPEAAPSTSRCTNTQEASSVTVQTSKEVFSSRAA